MASSPYKSPSSARRGQQGSAVREDRKVLFQDSNTSSKRKKKSGTSSTASEAQSIAQSLQRTQNLLKGELDRVSQVASAIDEDGKLLESTKTDLQEIDTKGAKKALTSLQRAQQQEQRVLMSSVLFFFAVVAYIMWERILIKLPFVERLLTLVLGNAKIVLGQGLELAMATGHQVMEQIQTMMEG